MIVDRIKKDSHLAKINEYYQSISSNKTQIMLVIIALFPSIILFGFTFASLWYFQSQSLIQIQSFAEQLYQDQISNSKCQNSALLFQINQQVQKIAWQMNLLNEFLHKVLLGSVLKNMNHIPALQNIDRSYYDNEDPVLLSLFKQNPILTTIWHHVSIDYLSQLDDRSYQQVIDATRVDSIWKSILFDNSVEYQKWIKIRAIYFGHAYDGLIYMTSQNSTYSNYQIPSGCPYTGIYKLDVRCRFYYQPTMLSVSTQVFSPQLQYGGPDGSTFLATAFCQRRLRYEQADPNSHSDSYAVLCITLDLTVIPQYFENFGSNSKFQMFLDPRDLTVVYDSLKPLEPNQIATVQEFETNYLQDKAEAQKFLHKISKNYQFLLQNTSSIELSNTLDMSQATFEYNRNGTECFVIMNTVKMIDMVPRYEYLRKINPSSKYQIKSVYLFLDVLSKQQMQQYSTTLQNTIKTYNLIFTYISWGIIIVILFIQFYYSIILGKYIYSPLIHLTNILKQIRIQNKTTFTKSPQDDNNQVQNDNNQAQNDNHQSQNDNHQTQNDNHQDQNDNNQDQNDNNQGQNDNNQGQHNISSQTGYYQPSSFIEKDSEMSNNQILIDEQLDADFEGVCFSSDTQILLESFQNMFKILRFTTQNFYKENESVSLLNLNLQIQHFSQFGNYRAMGVCHNNMGVIHCNCGRYQESVEHFQKAIIYAKYELDIYSHHEDGNTFWSKVQRFSISLRNSLQSSCPTSSGNYPNQDNSESTNRQRQQVNSSGTEKQQQSSSVSPEKQHLYWNLYNRNENYLKALSHFIPTNNQNHLWETFLEIAYENTSLSQMFLPPSNKREVMNLYVILIGYYELNLIENQSKILSLINKLYLKHFQPNSYQGDSQSQCIQPQQSPYFSYRYQQHLNSQQKNNIGFSSLNLNLKKSSLQNLVSNIEQSSFLLSPLQKIRNKQQHLNDQTPKMNSNQHFFDQSSSLLKQSSFNNFQERQFNLLNYTDIQLVPQIDKTSESSPNVFSPLNFRELYKKKLLRQQQGSKLQPQILEEESEVNFKNHKQEGEEDNGSAFFAAEIQYGQPKLFHDQSQFFEGARTISPELKSLPQHKFKNKQSFNFMKKLKPASSQFQQPENSSPSLIPNSWKDRKEKQEGESAKKDQNQMMNNSSMYSSYSKQQSQLSSSGNYANWNHGSPNRAENTTFFKFNKKKNDELFQKKFMSTKINYPVRKIKSDQKVSAYEFSSDIIFIYYALQQAKYLIQQKNYRSAADLLSNTQERCKYYLPHHKTQILNLLTEIFKINNIESTDLNEMKLKYDTYSDYNFHICLIASCNTIRNRKKVQALSQDIVNEILFKDSDCFGLLSYSFDEHIYQQLIGFTQIRTIKSNRQFFEHIFYSLVQKQQQNLIEDNSNYSYNNHRTVENQNLDQQQNVAKTEEMLVSESSQFKDNTNINLLQMERNKQVNHTDNNTDNVERNIIQNTSELKVQNTAENSQQRQQKFLLLQNHVSQMVTIEQQISEDESQSSSVRNSSSFESVLQSCNKQEMICNQNVKSYYQLETTAQQQHQINLLVSKQDGQSDDIFNNQDADQTAQSKITPYINQSQTQQKRFFQISNQSSTNSFSFSDFPNQIAENNNNPLTKFANSQSQSSCLKIINLHQYPKQEKQQQNIDLSFSPAHNKQSNIFPPTFKKTIPSSSPYHSSTHENKPSNHENKPSNHENKHEQSYENNNQINNEKINLEQDQSENSRNNNINDKNGLNRRIQLEQVESNTEYSVQAEEKSSELVFHYGVNAAIKQYILNTEQKLTNYLTKKKFIQDKKILKSDCLKQNQTYLIYTTDQPLKLNNKYLLNQLCEFLKNLQIELLVLEINENQTLEEFSHLQNIVIEGKSIISFFHTENKLLQYIYNHREHIKNNIIPMLFEHF